MQGDSRTLAVVAGLAGVAVLGALAWRYGRGVRVHHRERAAGVHWRLQAFLEAWAWFGPFKIGVVRDGGVRTDEAKQAQLYASGASKARTLKETPHGRAGAIDVAPVNDAGTPIFTGPREQFFAIGAFGKLLGLEWGGDFANLFDGPHLQVPGWKALPMPGVKHV